jgi:hypothetical protein
MTDQDRPILSCTQEESMTVRLLFSPLLRRQRGRASQRRRTSLIVVLTAVFALPVANSPSKTAMPLPETLMESIKGGVQADVVWPPGAPWGQSYDNLRFQANVISAFGQASTSLFVFADETKVASPIVSTPAPGFSGQMHTRTRWPFPGQRTMSIRFVDSGGNLVNAAGNSTLAAQYLLDTVKVHTIKFWNSSDPSGASTNLWEGALRAVVDRLEPAIPNSSSNTIDGLYASSCPVSTKTQWRYAGLGNINFTNTCSNIALLQSPGACIPQVCLDEVWNAIQNDPNNVHVVIVDNIGCGWAGLHWSSNGKYMILVEDNSFSNEEFATALLGHELGHTYVGGHVNSAADACGDPTRFTRNMMCSNTGRLMTATQCENARVSNRYVDRN